MAVPSVITDLNVAASSNSPAGTDSIGSTLDDYLRVLQAIQRREQAQGASIASASTTAIGANTDGNYVHITGTTTITSFGTVAAGISRVVVFDGALTLTHNATSLILPGGANITTAAGDAAEFISEGSGNWRCTKYVSASGFIRFAFGGNVASAATVDLTAATGNTVHITGTTGISAWTMTAGQVMDVIFDGALTLTHNSTTNNLPGAANITTVAGDRARYFYDGTTVYCLSYVPSSGFVSLSGNQTIAGTKTFSSPPTAKNIAKGWISLVGATGGTYTPVAGFGVTSITKNSTGNYDLTLTSALADLNPSVSVSVNAGNTATSGVGYNGLCEYSVVSSTVIRIKTWQYVGSSNTITAIDCPALSVAIFGS